MQNNKKKYVHADVVSLIDVKFKSLSFPLAAVWTDFSSLLVKGQTPNTIHDTFVS